MKSFYSVLLVLALSCTAVLAKEKEYTSDLDAAIKEATAEQKALFVMIGREGCGNCRSLKSMIDSRQVRLPKSSFIVVSMDIDDSTQKKLFKSHFDVTGPLLPFVAIAKPDGAFVAGRTGSGSAETYNDFIRDAKKEMK